MADSIGVEIKPGYTPYQPQLSPVAWAENVWTVEGPEVAYHLCGVSIPCPTRMTIVRLDDGSLWLHSPVTYSAALDLALAALGPVSALVAPSSYHHLHIASWAAVHPGAGVFATPDLVPKVGGGNCTALGARAPASWNGAIDSRLIDLGRFQEAVFLHRASRTLIVTDLMQNFEADRIRNPAIRLLLKAGGATGPDGRPSIEIRHAARRHRDALRGGVEQMISWRPASIILSHGKGFGAEAVAEIERAFAWVR